MPTLAASYAATKGLAVTAVVADFVRFPVDAVERRDAFLVNEADAAVVVWSDRDPDVRRVLARVERKGLPVHAIGGPEKKPRAVRSEPEPPNARVTGLTAPKELKAGHAPGPQGDTIGVPFAIAENRCRTAISSLWKQRTPRVRSVAKSSRRVRRS